MKEDLVWCDSCKKPMKEATEAELNGQLGLGDIDKPVILDDLCEGCAEELHEVILEVITRRKL